MPSFRFSYTTNQTLKPVTKKELYKEHKKASITKGKSRKREAKRLKRYVSMDTCSSADLAH